MPLWTVYFSGILFDLMTESELAQIFLLYPNVYCDPRKMVAEIL